MKIPVILVFFFLLAFSEAQPECTENSGVRCAFGDQGCEGQGCCEDTEEPACYIPDGPPEGPPGECTSEDGAKVDCGDVATDRESCLAEGCCWRPLEDSAPYPWCFLADGGGGSTTTDGSTTTGGGGSTTDMDTTTTGMDTTTTGTGTTTTTEASGNFTTPPGNEYCDVTEQFPCNTGDLTCVDMGCCFEPNASPYECWHSEAPPRGPPGAMCDQTIEEKVDCGVLGTDMEECIEVYGCCWRTRPEAPVYDPWCYEALPEAKKEPCSPNPCIHGACVEFKRGHYECDCKDGFKGRHCQIAIAEEEHASENVIFPSVKLHHVIKHKKNKP